MSSIETGFQECVNSGGLSGPLREPFLSRDLAVLLRPAAGLRARGRARLGADP